jgi:thiamine transport system ATP-binding protein
VLEVSGAVVRFGARAVVDDVDLTVEEGETVAVLGPSGCGKTTLLRAVAGLQPLDAGSIRWAGADLVSVPPHERRFGLMFQEYALFPHRNVRGNVEFGLRMIGAGAAERAARVDDILSLVGLGDLADRRVATLSGGEQQRVALARALAVEPRLLMLDEPLGALDREWRARLIDEIRALLAGARLPALYVTHDHTEAFALATRVAVMRGGRILQVGPPDAVWRRPADARVAGFLGFGPSASCSVRRWTLHTPWGDWPVSAADGPVELVLRPDAARLDDAGSIHARVTAAVFAGAHVTVTAQADGAPALTLAVDARDAPAVGATIRISFDSDGLLMYPSD